MSGDTSKIIAFNYFGGKFSWVEKLYSYFPEHVHFVDVFGGSFVVTLNKRPSRIETANDINGEVVNFFKVLRNSSDELIHLLELTPVSRDEFNESWTLERCSEVERARRFYVRIRQSFCGMGAQRKNKGWHLARRSGCGTGETVSRWHNGIEKLDAVVHRLTHVQIENKDFRKLIPQIDFKDAFFYCDPPYHREARCSYNDYKFEFTDKDHEDLANILNNISGKAMISGYDCASMKRIYEDRGWRKVSFPSKFNNLRFAQVCETIWMNYDVEPIQQTLFK